MGTSATLQPQWGKVETLIVARVSELPVGSWPLNTPRSRIERELTTTLAGVCSRGTTIQIRREAVFNGVLD